MENNVAAYFEEEDIVLALKKADIRKIIDGKHNINIRVYRGVFSKKLIDSVISVNNYNNANLTSREIEVLRYMIRGKNNAAIAEELCVSRHTVKAHVSNIIQKLGANDRFEAAIKAITEKIV